MKLLRFPLKGFLIAIALVAIALGGLVGWAHSRKRQVEAYRDEGAIAYFVHKPPAWLTWLGVERADPFFLWARVELYMTFTTDGVTLGDNPARMSLDEADSAIARKVSDLRSLGVDFIDLVIIGDLGYVTNNDGLMLAFDYTDSVIGEDIERYRLRLKANRETGKNTNPAYTPTTPDPQPPIAPTAASP